MKKWPTKPLADLCSVVGERAAAGCRPYLEIGNLNPESKVYDYSNKPAVKGAALAGRGDLVISRVRPTRGAITLICEESLAVSSAFTILRHRDEITARFLFFALAWNSAFLSYLGKCSKGALYPTVPEKDVLAFEIPVPPLMEQERLVQLLDEVDGMRKLRSQADRRTAAFIPALFDEMFGENIDDQQRWPMRLLGDLIANGPQNGLYKHSSFYGTGVPILRIDAFYDGEVEDLSALKRLCATPEEIERYGLREQDIVINRVNSPDYLGKSALIPSLSEPTVFESNMMRFALSTESVKPGYLIRYLQTPDAKRHILSRAKHSINQSSINQEDIKCLPVPLPPLPLQKMFTQRVTEIRAMEAAQSASRNELDSLFQSMLHRAFTRDL